MTEIEYVVVTIQGLLGVRDASPCSYPSHIDFLWDMWDETSAHRKGMDFGELDLLPMAVKIRYTNATTMADLFCWCSRRCW